MSREICLKKNSQKARIIIRVFSRDTGLSVTCDSWQRSPCHHICNAMLICKLRAPSPGSQRSHFLPHPPHHPRVLKGSISYIETLPVWKQNILAARSFVTPTHSYLAVISNKVLHILPHRINFMTDFEWNEWWEPQQEIFWFNKYGWNVFYETLVIFLKQNLLKEKGKHDN